MIKKISPKLFPNSAESVVLCEKLNEVIDYLNKDDEITEDDIKKIHKKAFRCPTLEIQNKGCEHKFIFSHNIEPNYNITSPQRQSVYICEKCCEQRIVSNYI